MRPSAGSDSTSQRMFTTHRTLTGTTSSEVGSRQPAGQLQSPRAKAHHLVHQRRKVMGLFAVVCLLAGGLYTLLYQFTAEVVVTPADRSVQLSSTQYQDTVQSYLRERPLERFRFMLDETALLRYMQQAMPEVARVTENGRGSYGQTVYSLVFRQPVAGWLVNDTQYYVDTAGVSFVTNHYAAPAVQIVDDSGVVPEGSEVVASHHFLGFVGQLVGLLETRNYDVREVTIPSGAIQTIEIRLADVAYPVRMTIGRGVGDQVEDTVRSIGWLARESGVQYLDVRVERKAFYR